MRVKNLTSSFQNKTWILLAVMLGAGLITFFILNRKEKEFKSTARLSIGPPESSRKKENEVLYEIDLQNHIEAMKTEYVGTLVSYNLLLHDLHETPFRRNSFLLSPAERRKIIVTLNQKLKDFEPLSPSDPFESKLQTVISQKRYDAARWIKDSHLQVSRVDKSNIVKVEFLSENPTLSAFVVNTLCSEYVRYNGFWNDGGGGTDSLNNAITEKQQELTAKANQLAAYKAKPIKSVDQDELTDRLIDYESQLDAEKAKADRLAASIRASETKIAQQPATAERGDISAATSAKVTQLQNKISELNTMYVKGGSKNEELAGVIGNLQNQLKLEQARLDQESSKSRTNNSNSQQLLNEKAKLETDQRETDSQIQSLQANINRLKRNISSSGSHERIIESMEQDYDKSYQEFVRMRDEYNRTKNDRELSETPLALKLVTVGVASAQPESGDFMATIITVMLIAGAITAIVIVAFAYFRAPNNAADSPLMILR